MKKIVIPDWQKDISDFLNTVVHKDKTYNGFFLVYKRRLKNDPEKQDLYQWVKANESEVIRFMKKHFNQTLRPFTLGRRFRRDFRDRAA